MAVRAALAACLSVTLLAAAAAADGGDEDIHEIRGPKFVAPSWSLPALLAGVAALALCGYAVWRWRHRARRSPVLSPHEAALARLEEITLLMQPSTAREFGIAVADVVRRYIEQRFDLTATQRTTPEFLSALAASSNPTLALHRNLLEEFLEHCDVVKFANLAATHESMERLRQSARQFVHAAAEPDGADGARSGA